MCGGPLPASHPLSLPRCKQNQDMLSFYAVIIGLNNAAISRLRLTWEVRGCGVPWTPPGAPRPPLTPRAHICVCVPPPVYLAEAPREIQEPVSEVREPDGERCLGTLRVLGEPQPPPPPPPEYLGSWWAGGVLALSWGVLAPAQATSDGCSPVPTAVTVGRGIQGRLGRVLARMGSCPPALTSSPPPPRTPAGTTRPTGRCWPR